MSENRTAKKFRGLLVAVIAATVGWGAATQAQVVKGNGPAGTIPVWTGNSTIGNSIVSQGGGTLNIGGGVKATGAISASSFVGSFSGDGSGLSNINASRLGGLSPNAFAQVGAQNTFTTTQTIDGNLNLTGSVNNTLTLQNDLTSNGFESSNVIGGFGGANGLAGNSVAAGVVGATIAGGGGSDGVSAPNTVTAAWGTIGGGAGNTAGGNRDSTVSGGFGNTANGFVGSVVGGGGGNVSSGDDSTVSGGYANHASGNLSAVPGGQSNTAAGEASFAAGSEANAKSNGSFVWSDDTQQPLNDFGPNTFTARASGGFAFYTGTSSGAYLPAGSGSWASLSDRNVKANLMAVDGHAILERLASLPIATWNYKSQSDSVRHMGPMAQDFREAFGLGEDEKHISTVDSEGVALAAIQALYRVNQELAHQVEELQNQVARLISSR